MKEKTDVDNIYLEQLYTFGDPLRHPNARVITCAYFALVRSEDIKIVSTPELGWHKVSDLPPLAYDHKEIIQYSLKEQEKDLNYALLRISCYQKNLRLLKCKSLRTYYGKEIG